MTRFYDPLLGRLVEMHFDFGKAMTRRHEVAALAEPMPVAGDDFSCATTADLAKYEPKWGFYGFVWY